MQRQQLVRLLEEGLTLNQMADRLGISASTIYYWLRRHGLQRDGGRRRQLVRAAKQEGRRHLELACRRHGRTMFVIEGSGNARCLRCRSEAVARRRRKVKEILVQEAGGCCVLCGYDRCAAALEFHHKDRTKKSFALSLRGITRSIARLREEAKKCVLLCATCHAEVEAGVVELPIK